MLYLQKARIKFDGSIFSRSNSVHTIDDQLNDFLRNVPILDGFTDHYVRVCLYVTASFIWLRVRLLTHARRLFDPDNNYGRNWIISAALSVGLAYSGGVLPRSSLSGLASLLLGWPSLLVSALNILTENSFFGSVGLNLHLLILCHIVLQREVSSTFYL